MKHVRKAYGYVTRKHNGTAQVLVFTHKFVPEAGIQIPKGTFREDESPLEAVTREIIEETGLTNFTVEREIAVDQWKYLDEADEVEERHFFLLTVPHPGDDEAAHPGDNEAPGAPDEWDHIVTGDGEDEGMVFHCFWVRNSLP
jgi:8-oxo-dGTP pyrophosphatase MutT (NUDIX family)